MYSLVQWISLVNKRYLYFLFSIWIVYSDHTLWPLRILQLFRYSCQYCEDFWDQDNVYQATSEIHSEILHEIFYFCIPAKWKKAMKALLWMLRPIQESCSVSTCNWYKSTCHAAIGPAALLSQQRLMITNHAYQKCLTYIDNWIDHTIEHGWCMTCSPNE